MQELIEAARSSNERSKALAKQAQEAKERKGRAAKQREREQKDAAEAKRLRTHVAVLQSSCIACSAPPGSTVVAASVRPVRQDNPEWKCYRDHRHYSEDAIAALGVPREGGSVARLCMDIFTVHREADMASAVEPLHPQSERDCLFCKEAHHRQRIAEPANAICITARYHSWGIGGGDCKCSLDSFGNIRVPPLLCGC